MKIHIFHNISNWPLGETNKYWHKSCKNPEIYVVSSEGLCGVDYKTFRPNPHWESMPDDIYNNWPDAKILIIIRRQPEIIKAYYTESLMKFATVKKFDEFYRLAFTNEYFNYHIIVQRYYKNFGKDNVLVLPLEMLKCNPNKFKAILSGWIFLITN